MVEAAASGSETAISRKPYPVDFSLADEHDQAHLRIDDGEEPPPLVLRIVNRAGRNMSLLADAQGQRRQASAAFHHFRLGFRPGTLAARTVLALRDPATAQTLLGAEAARWHIGVDEMADGTINIYLTYTGERPELVADQPLSVRLSGFCGAGGAARPTRVGFALGLVAYAGATEPVGGSARHAHLYVLHGGRAGLPLHIGFDGSATVRADGQPDRLELHIYNPSDKDAVGAAQGAEQPYFMLSFDHGDEPWSLWRGTGGHGVVPDISATGPAGMLAVEHLGHQQEANPLRWRLSLPPAGIPPGASVYLTIDGIVSRTEGAANLYMDGYDLPGYANSRHILSFGRSLVTSQILDERLAALERGLVDRINSRAHLSVAADYVAITYDLAWPARPVLGDWPGIEARFDIDHRQQWRDLRLSNSVDASRNYVLDSSRVVRPIIGDVAGEPLPAVPFSGHPIEIGEFRGLPLVLYDSGMLYCYHPQEVANEGWYLVFTEIVHVGEGWVAVQAHQVDAAGHALCRVAHLEARSEDGRHDFTADGDGRPYSVAALGGTRRDPLFVDTRGAVWQPTPDLGHGAWAKMFEAAVVDVNAFGVMTHTTKMPVKANLGPRRLFRFCNAWRELHAPDLDLQPDGAVRVGGSWHNPIIVVENGSAFRLSGSTNVGPWLNGARNA